MNVNGRGAQLTFHWRFVSSTQHRHHQISLGIHRLATVTWLGFGFSSRQQLLLARNLPIPSLLWNFRGIILRLCSAEACLARWKSIQADENRWFVEYLPSVCAKRAPQPHVQPKLFFSIYLMVDGILDMCHNDRVNPAFCTPNPCCNGIVNAFSDDERSAARTILFMFTLDSDPFSQQKNRWIGKWQNC